METLLYLLKVNLYWGAFYACYWLLLRKHTFFHWNRFYLLGSLLIAFVLPALRFSAPVTTIYVPETVYQKATISVAVVAGHAPQTGGSEWLWLIAAAYLAGVVVLGWQFLSGLRRLARIARQSETISMGRYTLVMLPECNVKPGGSSFSFFHWLFLSAHDYRHSPDAVIRHECEHIRQWHTADILVVELLKIGFWFNPVLWLYKRSIQTVHEYLADQPVPNRHDYASFLVAYALRSPDIAVANHFFNSSMLKNRIDMIYKKRSSRWLLGKYLLILPVLMCSMAISASRSPLQAIQRLDAAIGQNIRVKGNLTNEQKEPVSDAIVIVAGTTHGTTTDRNGWFEVDNVPAGAKLVITHVAYQAVEVAVSDNQTELMLVMKKAVNQITGPVIVGKPASAAANVPPAATPSALNHNMQVVEQQPQFPGGREALMQYLMQNLEYPEIARQIRLEAIALVSFTVDKNGEIRNAKSLKNIGYGIDKEALRVVNDMPKWNPAVQNGKPVEMEYTLEVKFKMEDKSEEKRQGFMNFRDITPASSMEKIGKLFGNPLDILASGKVPEVRYGAVNYKASSNAATEYMSNDNGTYRYLNYGLTSRQYAAPVLKYRAK